MLDSAGVRLGDAGRMTARTRPLSAGESQARMPNVFFWRPCDEKCDPTQVVVAALLAHNLGQQLGRTDAAATETARQVQGEISGPSVCQALKAEPKDAELRKLL